MLSESNTTQLSTQTRGISKKSWLIRKTTRKPKQPHPFIPMVEQIQLQILSKSEVLNKINVKKLL